MSQETNVLGMHGNCNGRDFNRKITTTVTYSRFFIGQQDIFI